MLITPATLILTAADTTKTYGTQFTDVAGSSAFTSSGLKNSDSIGSVSIHFALGGASTAPPSSYANGISLDSPHGDRFLASNYKTTFVPGKILVTVAPLYIFANDTSRLFGTSLKSVTASASFTTTGLQNSDFIQSVNLSFGNATTIDALPNSYAGDVIASAPVGPLFSSANYDITYFAGGLFINPISAVLDVAGNIASMTSVYPNASPTGSFIVSGDSLMSSVVARAPVGYELSLSGFTGFNSTLTLPYSMVLSPTLVYYRLEAGGAAGSYPGTITFSSYGALDINKVLSPGTIYPTALSISADSIAEVYGTLFSEKTDSTGFTTRGMIKGQRITSVMFNPDSLSARGIRSAGSVFSRTPSAATGSGGYLPGNYTITYIPYLGIVQKRALTLIPDNKTRFFGEADSVLTGTYSGFANGDGSAVLSHAPVFTTNETLASLPGTYIISAGGAVAANYSIRYGQGILTVLASPVIIPPIIPTIPTTVLSSDAGLMNLTISPGTLNSLFLNDITNYTAMVENQVSSIMMVTSLSDPHASLTVNGRPDSSGMSIPLELGTGDNIFSIRVTAQDGVTQKIYSIIVHRSVAPDAVSATNLLSPNGDGKNDTWIVKDIGQYPRNTVTVFDLAGRVVYTRKGYKNEWNASYKGAALMNGTYFYIIDLGIGGPAIKGFITVMTPSN